MSRVLFCNIAYMKYYSGITQDDRPINGGKYVRENGDAGEKFNFRLSDGIIRGFVETKYHNDSSNEAQPNQIHIERIDKSFSNKDDSIENVTVFFCATKPKGNRVIVGWYKNATVFRFRQFKECFGETLAFYMFTKAENAYLIPVEKRTFQVRTGKDAFGQSQVWYAEKAPQFIESALEYIRQTEADMKKTINQDKAVLEQIDKRQDLSETEREILGKARIGQGGFRQQLLERDRCCRICGLYNQQLLVASHIQPWSKSNNDERLDSENGLLLCALHDALFDKGLISFDDDGNMLVSYRLSPEERTILHIPEVFVLSMSPRMQKYMKSHRDAWMAVSTRIEHDRFGMGTIIEKGELYSIIFDKDTEFDQDENDIPKQILGNSPKLHIVF